MCRFTRACGFVEPLNQRLPLLHIFPRDIALHLVHADAQLRTSRIILRVTDRGDYRNPQRLKEPDQRLVR